MLYTSKDLELATLKRDLSSQQFASHSTNTKMPKSKKTRKNPVKRKRKVIYKQISLMNYVQ